MNGLPQNPYRWDRPNLDLFYGRDALLQELATDALGGRSSGIAGGRRMGKTTLLRRLERDLQKGTIEVPAGVRVLPVYVDLLAFEHLHGPDPLYDFILRCAEDGFGVHSSTPVPGTIHPFAARLGGLLAAVHGVRPHLVFLFDETESILGRDWADPFLGNWRSFLSNEPRLSPWLSAVFAGASEIKSMQADTSPLGNVLRWHELANLSMDDMRRMALEPTGFSFPETFLMRLFDMSGGHPFLVQYLLEYVCHRDLTDAGHFLEMASERLLQTDSVHFSHWWSRFDGPTRRAYALLADLTHAVHTTTLSINIGGEVAARAIATLCHTGVARWVEPGTLVESAGSLFRTWFDAHGRHDMMPSPIDSCDRLIYELEGRMRSFLTAFMHSKHGDRWPSRVWAVRKPELYAGWLKSARRDPQVGLSADEALVYSDPKDLFEIVLEHWPDMRDRFSFTLDASKQRVLFEERKEAILGVRNAIRHARAATLTPLELRKAELFCMELLDRLAP